MTHQAEGVKGVDEMASGNGGVSTEVFDRLTALETENEQLRAALESRIIIEQAKGAISVRCDVSPETAFKMLRGLARSQRLEIHEYAAEVVANGGRLSVKDEDRPA
jgi:AmiR/NasT family two-component response regulator